jgi:ribonuclease HI
MIEVYIDGSSKGNPGPGGAGIVIQDTTAKEIIGIHGIPLGYVTNNQAEFLALKHALMELKNQRRSSNPVNILTDSQLVVGIFSQNWKARANLELVMEIRDLLREFSLELLLTLEDITAIMATSSPILWRRKRPTHKAE